MQAKQHERQPVLLAQGQQHAQDRGLRVSAIHRPYHAAPVRSRRRCLRPHPMPPVLSKVLAIARFTLLEAVRTRLLWIVLVILALLFLGSLFVQHIAVTETARMQTGFLAATARMAAVFMLACMWPAAWCGSSTTRAWTCCCRSPCPGPATTSASFSALPGSPWSSPRSPALAARLVAGAGAGSRRYGAVSLALELTLVAR